MRLLMGFDGLSLNDLNDCMEDGSCILSNLTEMLLRYLHWQTVIKSDTRKHSPRSVLGNYYDVQHFLLDVNGTTKVIKFMRVPLGNCNSLFLPSTTEQFYMTGFPALTVAEELKQNMYVHHFLSGADSVEASCPMVKDAINIMSKSCMHLVMLRFNSPDFANICMTGRSFISKLFDRLGFGTPYVLQAKCLLLELRTLGLESNPSFPH